MPAKRTGAGREQKVGQILDVAERQLDTGGVQGISMAAIARELGVAQNTIRWYFPSRGDLVVATMRRLLEKLAGGKPRGRDLQGRILWWTDQLAPIYRYRTALQSEAAHSPAAAEFVAELDATIDRMLMNGLRGRVPDENLAQAVDAFRATVNGTYAEGLTRPRRRAILAYAVSRLGGATD